MNVALLQDSVTEPAQGARDVMRVPTNTRALDLVLGGGAVVGSTILLHGSSGVGKSTLLLQIAIELACCDVVEVSGKPLNPLVVMLVVADETFAHIRERAKRLSTIARFDVGTPVVASEARESGIRLHLLQGEDRTRGVSIHEIERCMADYRPDIVLVDSIENVFHHEVKGRAGTPRQVRESVIALEQMTKTHKLVCFIAWTPLETDPEMLDHTVDVRVSLSGDGTRESLRTLEAHKNRFAPVAGRGLLKMTPGGLVSISTGEKP